MPRRFTGSSIAVYGGIAVTHGVYSVICDGVSQEYAILRIVDFILDTDTS